METGDVRKRVIATMDKAKRQAAERRAAADRSAQAFERVLATNAVPLVRQIAGALKADNYPFTVFTPTGSVRLMSDKSAEDFIEIALDTINQHDRVPRVTAHVSRARGRSVVEGEHVIGSGDPAAI